MNEIKKGKKGIDLERHSIKTKLVLLFGGLTLVICLLMAVISYNIASSGIIKNVDDMLPTLAEESSIALENLINGKFETLHITANNLDHTTSTVLKREYLYDQQERGGYLLLGTADVAGNMLTSGGISINVREYDFFQKALSGQNAVSEPTVDIFEISVVSPETTDEETVEEKVEEKVEVDGDAEDLVVIYAVPMYVDGKITHVLIGVRPSTEFFDFFDKVKFGETGEAFMINESGDIISHSDRDLVNNKVNYINEAEKDSSLEKTASIIRAMSTGQVGAEGYVLEGEEKYAGYAPVPLTGWSIAATGDKADILSGLSPLRTTIAIITIVLLVVGISAAYVIAETLTKSINVVVEGLGYMAKGDLTRDIPEEYLEKKDEMGTLAVSIQSTQVSFREMLNQINGSSNNIDNQAENLSAISQQLTSASESVSMAIQDVAKGAGSQAQGLSDMTETMNDFSKELETIVHAIQDIDDNAGDISVMSTESNREIQTLKESSMKIGETFNEFVNKINGFNQNIKQIDEIAEVINDIADETNLLALNAAIEAARSGEAGRGFAVVAEQIRRLAEETKTSSNNINDIVIGISTESEAMVEDTGNVDRGLKDQVVILNSTIDLFKMIEKAIAGIANEIESVNSSAFQLDGRKNGIVEGIGEVASISEEVSSSSQEIAASSEEMNASMEEIAASAELLKEMTDETMRLVGRFKL